MRLFGILNGRTGVLRRQGRVAPCRVDRCTVKSEVMWKTETSVYDVLDTFRFAGQGYQTDLERTQ